MFRSLVSAPFRISLRWHRTVSIGSSWSTRTRKMVPVVDDEVSDVSDELIASIEALLPDFLPRQRWYGSDTAPEVVKVVSQRTLSHEPLLLWLLVDTTGRAGDVEGVSDTPDASGDQATERYQLVVAGRPVGSEEKFLTGKERVTLGAVDGLVLYDAL